MLGIETFFSALPTGVRAVVLDAAGDHFSAGLDLVGARRDATRSRASSTRACGTACSTGSSAGACRWSSVLKGAVIGGGLELAAATHIRVAEPSAFYALPEGQRGLFVGGGGSVRLPRLIGAHRMADMMLTGRVLDADEGQALGLSQYRVEAGEGLATALELARTIAGNSPVTNFAVLQALPRIAEANPAEGYLMESLMAAVSSSSSDEAKDRMRAFLDGRAGRRCSDERRRRCVSGARPDARRATPRWAASSRWLDASAATCGSHDYDDAAPLVGHRPRRLLVAPSPSSSAFAGTRRPRRCWAAARCPAPRGSPARRSTTPSTPSAAPVPDDEPARGRALADPRAGRADLGRAARAGGTGPRRPAAPGRRPGRPRGGLPAQHPRDPRRVPRDRQPRRDLGDAARRSSGRAA